MGKINGTPPRLAHHRIHVFQIRLSQPRQLYSFQLSCQDPSLLCQGLPRERHTVIVAFTTLMAQYIIVAGVRTRITENASVKKQAVLTSAKPAIAGNIGISEHHVQILVNLSAMAIGLMPYYTMLWTWKSSPSCSCITAA
eukprot:11797400-Karenia_brevis.AAC.1